MGRFCGQHWFVEFFVLDHYFAKNDTKELTYFSRDFVNICATSRPSVLATFMPFVQRISSPWSILSWLRTSFAFSVKRPTHTSNMLHLPAGIRKLLTRSSVTHFQKRKPGSGAILKKNNDTHSESERKHLAWPSWIGVSPITRKISLHKCLKTLCAKVEQVLAIPILLFFGETIFWLW